jgi:hypothetical protein
MDMWPEYHRLLNERSAYSNFKEAAENLNMCFGRWNNCDYEPRNGDVGTDRIEDNLTRQLVRLMRTRNLINAYLQRWHPLNRDANFGHNKNFNTEVRGKIRQLISQLNVANREIANFLSGDAESIIRIDIEGVQASFRVKGYQKFRAAITTTTDCLLFNLGLDLEAVPFGGFVVTNQGVEDAHKECMVAGYDAFGAKTYFGDHGSSPLLKALVGPGTGIVDLLAHISMNGNTCGGPDTVAYYGAHPSQRSKLPPPLGGCVGATNESQIRCQVTGICSNRSNVDYKFDFTDLIDSKIRIRQPMGSVWSDWSQCLEHHGSRTRRFPNSIKDLRTTKDLCTNPY